MIIKNATNTNLSTEIGVACTVVPKFVLFIALSMSAITCCILVIILIMPNAPSNVGNNTDAATTFSLPDMSAKQMTIIVAIGEKVVIATTIKK